MGTTRRKFLAGAAATAAAAVVPTRWADAQTSSPFPFGVGSFDPLHDRVIIWTRTTAFDRVTWEVARDAQFADIVRSGVALPVPAEDHTIHVDVDGLQPATRYWYRFVGNGQASTVGRTQTLPAPGAAVDRLRFGVVTCAEWEFGFFGGYRALAERDDIDVVLALGDYIYEFDTSYGGIPSPKRGGRTHKPTHEAVSLVDYRTRHQQYRSDPGLQKLHAAFPVIAIYDDHEVCNDWWREGGQGHDPATQGDFIARRNAGLRAFQEWVPHRGAVTGEPERAYRRFTFGNLVDLFMVDERRYRDEQPASAIVGYGSVDPAVDDPNRTMLGAAQRDWLLNGLATSPSAWKVLGNPVSWMPIDVGPALAGALSAALSPLGALPPIPPPLLVEGWDGYNAERTRILTYIADNKIRDVVILTGDYHESFATELPVDRSTYELDGNSAAVEFIAPPITSPGLSETLQMGDLPNALTINTVFEANLAASNPWVKYHEGFSSGYAVAEFRADGMQLDYVFIASRDDPNTQATPAASWKVGRGSAVLAQATGPLGPRPAVAPAPSAPAPTGNGLIPRTGNEQAAALALGAAAVGALAARRISSEFLQDQ